MNKAFREFKDTFKSGDTLLPSLRRHVLKQAAEDEMSSNRRSDIMHPSEMSKSDWCPRSDFYRITLGKRFINDYTFQRQMIFAEGHAIHNKYQRWLRQMGILYGKWHCHSCDSDWMGVSPESCHSGCGSTDISYREVPLVDENLLIAGHADGAVIDGKDWFDVGTPFLIEIKSVGIGTVRSENPSLFNQYANGEMNIEDVWSAIKRPFPSHLRQATLYCHLGGFNQMLFIYECKWNQQVKEFAVTPNFNIIAPIIEGAESVADAIQTGTVPERPFWANSEFKTCTKCLYNKECWGESSGPVTISVRRSTAAKRRKFTK